MRGENEVNTSVFIAVFFTKLNAQYVKIYSKVRWNCASDALATQYHKTVSWNCKRSVALLQVHEENILPYTVKIDSARAVTTISRNFRLLAIWKSLKMPEWNFSSIHGRCMNKIVYTNS